MQDWADFTDVAAQAVAALDAGQVAERDVYERIRPGYMYHVSHERQSFQTRCFVQHIIAGMHLVVLQACWRCAMLLIAVAAERLEPAYLYHTSLFPLQVMINSILINNRPEWCRWRLSHTMLPGESEAAAAARWQQVAVRATMIGALACKRQCWHDLVLRPSVPAVRDVPAVRAAPAVQVKMGITHSQALRIQRAYQASAQMAVVSRLGMHTRWPAVPGSLRADRGSTAAPTVMPPSNQMRLSADPAARVYITTGWLLLSVQDYCARLSELAAESAVALEALAEAKQVGHSDYIASRQSACMGCSFASRCRQQSPVASDAAATAGCNACANRHPFHALFMQAPAAGTTWHTPSHL